MRRVRLEKRSGRSKYERPQAGQCSSRVCAWAPQCGQVRSGASGMRAKIWRTSSRVRARAASQRSSSDIRSTAYDARPAAETGRARRPRWAAGRV
jgi:hypothetical protein